MAAGAMRGSGPRAGSGLTGVALCALAVSGTAVAQGVPALPSTSDPSRVQERLQAPARPTAVPPLELGEPETTPPPAVAGAITFALTAVELVGAEGVPRSRLEPLWADLVGREITLLQAYDLRDAITAAYRSAGFALSQAVLPAQRIEGGVLRVEVLEGFVASVSFEGDAADLGPRVAPFLAAARAERPLRLATLEQALLLIDDLPGVKARTVLRAADGVRGGTELVVVLERVWGSASLSVDNRGSRAIGRLQADASAQVNTLDGRGQLSVRTLAAKPIDELLLFDGGFSYAVGSAGTVLSAGVRKSTSLPGDLARTVRVFNDTRSVRIGATHPLWRGASDTLRVFAEANGRRSETFTFYEEPGQTPLSRDQVFALTAGASWDVADRWGGSNLLSASGTKGLPWFGSKRSDRAGFGRADGNTDFVRLNVSATREQPLGGAWSASLGAEGQYSPTGLLSADEYGVGGRSYGRAFDPSEVTGDSGAATALEVRYTLGFPGWEAATVQAFGYADAGAVHNRNATPRAGWQAVSSTGVGLRLFVGAHVSGSFLLAKPLSDHAADTGRPVRPFFSLTVRF